MMGIEVELILESVIVYRGAKPNEINYKDNFILRYSQKDLLESFKATLEQLITNEFGCEKGYYWLFDRRREKRLDLIMNGNIHGKTIDTFKELGFSIFLEDNSI